MPRCLFYTLLILLMLLPGKLHGQNFEAGPFLGFSAYNGDLNTERVFHKIYPAAGAVARFNHNQRLSTRINATYTVLRGSDRSTVQRYRNVLGHPDGVGVKYNVSSNFSGSFEIGMRITGTDYLDEVSRKGDPGQNDWYSFTGLTLTYGFDGYRSFRSGKGCPY